MLMIKMKGIRILMLLMTDDEADVYGDDDVDIAF